MKKNLSIFVLTGLITASMMVWIAHAATITAPTLFRITPSTITTTTLATTWTLGATNCDSTNVIIISGSDTLFIGGNLTNTATSKTLTGLIPRTQYILALRIRRNDSTAVSNKDTMYTAWPQSEPAEWEKSKDLLMYGARSWLPSTITYDTLYVPDATGLDSTMVYRAWPYTGIQAKVVAPHADSAKVLLRIFPGYHESQNIAYEATSIHDRLGTTGVWGFENVAPDSLNLTKNGWNMPYTVVMPVAPFFYITADGQTGNGHTTKVIIRMRRDRW